MSKTYKKETPTWSAHDEQLFQELQQRRTEWNTVHFENLRRALGSVLPKPLTIACVELFAKNADTIRDALAPFDSGVRVSTRDEG